MEQDEKEMSYGEHLEELRRMLFRILLSVLLFSALCFCLKDQLFDLLLAPQQPDFILYRLLGHISDLLPDSSSGLQDFQVSLINTELTGQFVTHMKVSLFSGMLLAAPHIIYELFRFIAPALRQEERHSCLSVLFPAICCFLCGLLLSYFLIFPLSFRFLATYQISENVTNMISLTSYFNSFILLSLFLGAAFEIPVIAWLLGRTGILDGRFMKRYRRHALVVILVAAAVITPTSDIFTLLLVSIPLYLLYEISIRVVDRPS